ncbi:hypothetical protein [Chryseobacterium sp. SG20098]|uniref:hypothetical protein n=1 Tax=Chryseobacterium sp. SG20098 TaxID=3074145 RepID=UPI002882E11F|nr:hypothetical protein [Chryseobacterium sp. SG20098]WNI34739.1 hypothetical protein RHP76_12195 [Chryseobacterium sp. SG20098]
MKQLEIKTNKRLLIVETDMAEFVASLLIGDFFPKYELEFICKGSDLTEDIAKGFLHQSIHTGLFAHYVKDIPVNTYCYKTALEAFGAVIYASGLRIS